MDLPSKHLQTAVDEISSLPGIGKKTALRLALHLLGRSTDEITRFSGAIQALKAETQFCKECGNISDAELCGICVQTKRDRSTICVVEDLRDIIAIEATQQYQGVYHVLGGIISPMDGIGPNELNIAPLIEKANGEEVKEIILALSATMEGDTTNFYLFKRLQDTGVTVSTIARGVGIGDELEYTDEITLGRSIAHRTPFEQSLTR